MSHDNISFLSFTVHIRNDFLVKKINFPIKEKTLEKQMLKKTLFYTAGAIGGSAVVTSIIISGFVYQTRTV